MTFFNGNTSMDAYVDFLTTQLVGTGVWSEPDAGFYPAGASPAKRVLTDGTSFLFLQRIVSNGHSNGAGGVAENGAGSVRFNEIRATFSTAYNLGTHLQTGTTQNCGIPFEGWQKASSGNSFFLNNDVGNGNKGFQHFTWVDPTGSVHGIIVANLSAATFDYICFFALERNTTKQYADGFTNLYWTCFPSQDNIFQTGAVSTVASYFHKLPYDFFSALRNVVNGSLVYTQLGGGGNLNRPVYFHPFNGLPTFNEPIYIGAGSNAVNVYYDPPWQSSMAFNPAIGGRYPGFETFFTAYRSPGDSKAYFQFPWFNANNDPLRRSLIAQTQDQWFKVGDTSYGLTDGDIIDYTAPGPILKRYLVKQLTSQDGISGVLTIAMRFA